MNIKWFRIQKTDSHLKNTFALLAYSVLLFVVLTINVQAQEPDSVRFAAIGDFGRASSSGVGQVADMIDCWNPDLIITLGDNNYENGQASTIDANVGQFYHEYIGDYNGSYGAGSASNRFYPSLGNHDWRTRSGNPALPYPHLDYFTLPGNERYYSFREGPVEFFVVDSDSHEPDGRTSNSVQALWLQAALANSTALWKIVYMHHPPYSSGWHGNETVMQWPYKAWGATAVLAGHDHNYERLSADGMPYFVNGLGGKDWRAMGTIVNESVYHYTGNFGAMRVDANYERIKFDFYTVPASGCGSEQLRDTLTITNKETEPNQTQATADGPLYLDGSNFSGTADGTTVYDWSFFELQTYGIVKITLDGSAPYVAWGLFKDGVQVANGSEGQTVSYQANNSGTYYIRVYGYQGVSYALSVKGPYEIEPDNNFPRFKDSGVGLDGSKKYGISDGYTNSATRDWYGIPILAPGKIDILLDGEAPYTAWRLYSPMNGWAQVAHGSEGQNVSFTATQFGLYYLENYGYTGVDYALSVKLTGLLESEPNNTASSADGPVITDGSQLFYGTSDSGYGGDWFYFDLNSPNRIEIKLNGEDTYVSLSLYKNGTLVAYASEGESVFYDATQSGRYEMKVIGYSGIDYSIFVKQH